MTDKMLRKIWREFDADGDLQVAVSVGVGEKFTTGADFQDVCTRMADGRPHGRVSAYGRGGTTGITRGPLSRIAKPIPAAIDGRCVGHGVEPVMACNLWIATAEAKFGTFKVRRGMHPADAAIVRLLNYCRVSFTLELLLTRESVLAERAYTASMVNRDVQPDQLMEQMIQMVQQILRCDQPSIRSTKENTLE